jgi:hypothetical protein
LLTNGPGFWIDIPTDNGFAFSATGFGFQMSGGLGEGGQVFKPEGPPETYDRFLLIGGISRSTGTPSPPTEGSWTQLFADASTGRGLWAMKVREGIDRSPEISNNTWLWAAQETGGYFFLEWFDSLTSGFTIMPRL